MVVFFSRLPLPSKDVSRVAEAPANVPVPDAKQKKETPGKSCGHCGTRIKGEPIRGVMVDGTSYHVYACPTCKKETLLAVKLV